MKRRTLKYVIAVAIGLIECQQAQGCPTCVGKSMLEMKQPFFKVHHPDGSSMEQAVSLQTTNTSTKQNDDEKQKIRKEKA